MSYDGENRPVWVAFAGKTTTYVYGADGTRLKKVESDPVAEILGHALPRRGGDPEVWARRGGGDLLYPQPNIRITRTKSGSTVTTKVNALHADGLGAGSGQPTGRARWWSGPPTGPTGQGGAAFAAVDIGRDEGLHRRAVRRRRGAPVLQRPLL